MSATSKPPIVLIHGFWVTPRSWEDWKAHFEAKGHEVHTPAYPGFEVEVEALNADPTPIVELSIPEAVEKIEALIGGLDQPPILMGHSAGGVITQILLDHGFGACGVAINSAPTEGVPVVPLTQIKSTFPVLKNPANRHRAVGFTAEQWHYAFTNTFSEEESQRLYERYHVPACGGVLFATRARQRAPGPGRQLGRLRQRRPGAAAVHLRQPGPPDAAQGPALEPKQYKSDTVTEIVEFDGPHLLPSCPGWEEVADHALDWAMAHLQQHARA